MDTAGGVVGPLLAVLLLASGWSLRSVLQVAVVPGVLTLFFVTRVREAPARAVLIIASITAGLLWSHASPEAPFQLGAGTGNLRAAADRRPNGACLARADC